MTKVSLSNALEAYLVFKWRLQAMKISNATHHGAQRKAHGYG